MVTNMAKRITTELKGFDILNFVCRSKCSSQELFNIILPRRKTANCYYGLEVIDVYGDSFFSYRYYFGNYHEFYESKNDCVEVKEREMETGVQNEYSDWNVWKILGIACLVFLMVLVTMSIAVSLLWLIAGNRARAEN